MTQDTAPVQSMPAYDYGAAADLSQSSAVNPGQMNAISNGQPCHAIQQAASGLHLSIAGPLFMTSFMMPLSTRTCKCRVAT